MTASRISAARLCWRSVFPAFLLGMLLLAGCSSTDGTSGPGPNPSNDPPCSCTVGTRRCSGSSQVQICETQSAACASWGPSTACPGDAACSNGACQVNCQDQCTAGVRRCAGESSAEVCRIGPSGCLEWVKEPCSTDKYCEPVQLSCIAKVACEPACPAGYRCQPNGVCSGGSPTGLVFNVKTVQLSGKITLNGVLPQKLSLCSSYPSDYKARVTLTETTRGYTFYLDSACKDSGFDVSAAVFPGTYRVRVRGGYYSNLSNLPIPEYEAESALVLNTDVSGKVWDVRTVQLAGKITLNGVTPQKLSLCTSYPSDYKGRVTLTETTRGYTFYLDSACKDAGFDVAAAVYPGTYRVRVRGGYYSNLSDLPIPEYEAESALMLNTDVTGKVWDVRTVQLAGKITLNGVAPQKLSLCTSYPSDYKGRVTLTESTRGYTFYLDSACKDAGFDVAAAVYPGTYRVRVRGGYYSNLSDLPIPEYEAESALAVTTDVSGKVWDVRTVQFAGKITLNGADPQKLSLCTSYPSDYKARVVLSDTVHGYRFNLDSPCSDASFAVSAPVYPGTYTVSVRGGYYSNLSNLPIPEYIAKTGLVVAGPLSGQVWDVRTVQLAGKITLNGVAPQKLSLCSSYPSDYKARVSLTDAKQGYSFNLDSPCQDAGFDVAGAVYPGTYSVKVRGGYYSNLSTLPIPLFEAEKGLALTTDVSGKVWDVRTHSVSGTITLNGAAPQKLSLCSSYPSDYKARVVFTDINLGTTFNLDSLCKDPSFDVASEVYAGIYSVQVRGGYYSSLSDLPIPASIVCSRLQIP